MSIHRIHSSGRWPRGLPLRVETVPAILRMIWCADVAKLADAQPSEGCDRKVMEVQLLSSAPTQDQFPGSVAEAAVANKLAQDRSRRHQMIGDAEEAGQERQQAPRLGVLRVVRFDLDQQRLDERFENRQLVV